MMSKQSVKAPYEKRDNEFIAWYPNALDPGSDEAVWKSPEAAFYIHIPFCDQICEYCGFAVTQSKGANIDDYIDHLIQEIQRADTSPFLETKRFTVGHFGGGTPSVLNGVQLERILQAVTNVTGMNALSELTLEANPISLTKDKARAYHSLGVNRLSIGIQSFNEEHLRAIGRPHRPKESIEAYETARFAGFDNVSIDLMYDLPGQTIENLFDDLNTCVELRPDHISMFQLERIPMTPLAMKEKLGLSKRRHNDNMLMEMQKLVFDTFVGEGYLHYGAFNFALPGKESEHNRIAFVAPQGEYIGWGNGAYSFMNGCVFCNDVSVDRYKHAIAENGSATTYYKKASLLELASRYVVLGLKFLKVPLEPFREIFGEDISYFFGGTLDRLCIKGMITIDTKFLRLTDAGMMYVNNVCKEFYIGENRGKTQFLQYEPTISAKTINRIMMEAGLSD